MVSGGWDRFGPGQHRLEKGSAGNRGTIHQADHRPPPDTGLSADETAEAVISGYLRRSGVKLVHQEGDAAFLEGRLNVSELARVCGVSRPTVYKYLRLVE